MFHVEHLSDKTRHFSCAISVSARDPPETVNPIIHGVRRRRYVPKGLTEGAAVRSGVAAGDAQARHAPPPSERTPPARQPTAEHFGGEARRGVLVMSFACVLLLITKSAERRARARAFVSHAALANNRAGDPRLKIQNPPFTMSRAGFRIFARPLWVRGAGTHAGTPPRDVDKCSGFDLTAARPLPRPRGETLPIIKTVEGAIVAVAALAIRPVESDSARFVVRLRAEVKPRNERVVSFAEELRRVSMHHCRALAFGLSLLITQSP